MLTPKFGKAQGRLAGLFGKRTVRPFGKWAFGKIQVRSVQADLMKAGDYRMREMESVGCPSMESIMMINDA